MDKLKKYKKAHEIIVRLSSIFILQLSILM